MLTILNCIKLEFLKTVFVILSKLSYALIKLVSLVEKLLVKKELLI